MVTFKMLALWAIVLVLQNASFTAVSRARNSGSDWYHAVASIFSNGIWFVSQTYIVVSLLDVAERASVADWVMMLAVYIGATVFGSVTMGKLLRKHVEKGKRRVGYYEPEPAFKYLVFPGEVVSATDGDIHHVSSDELMRLYGVSPKECRVIHGQRAQAYAAQHAARLYPEVTILRPREDGNYEMPA